MFAKGGRETGGRRGTPGVKQRATLSSNRGRLWGNKDVYGSKPKKSANTKNKLLN